MSSHQDITCDHCHQKPIVGTRFKCGNCPDYDLCERCIPSARSIHDASHCFLYLDRPTPLRLPAPALSIEFYPPAQTLHMAKPAAQANVRNSAAFSYQVPAPLATGHHSSSLSFIDRGQASSVNPRSYTLRSLAPQDLSAVVTSSALASSVRRFALRLLQKLSQPHQRPRPPQESFIVSPLSIWLALGVMALGARGQTYKEMSSALYFENSKAVQQSSLSEVERECTKEDIIVYVRAIKGRYAPLSSANQSSALSLRLDTATAFIAPDTFPISMHFRDEVCDKAFGAEIFQGRGVLQPNIVNTWVSSRTKGLIPSLLEGPLHIETAFVILNAVYLKGKWRHPFPKRNTHSSIFYPQNPAMSTVGGKDCQMMYQESASLSYFETEAVQALRLPYISTTDSQGDFGQSLPSVIAYPPHLSAVVLLPKPPHSVCALLEILQSDSTAYTEVLAGLRVEQGEEKSLVQLWLPKFEARYRTTLRDPLTRMGMAEAFHHSADFSDMLNPVNIGDERAALGIGEIIHEAYINVDEEGTEAAAATAVVCFGAAAPRTPPRTVKMRIDHPFLFLVVDDDAGDVLFGGLMRL